MPAIYFRNSLISSSKYTYEVGTYYNSYKQVLMYEVGTNSINIQFGSQKAN